MPTLKRRGRFEDGRASHSPVIAFEDMIEDRTD
uniref:Uncharacterized protein n=1 Tax=Pristionchus pacificus TaxID=54126 RepID=A0A2A6BDM5_PRIPA|eukprot:PDM63973.1 hypothetical protein PRIPAC_49474 [Pristionchus pacificus]